jgi:hypothetical protein
MSKQIEAIYENGVLRPLSRSVWTSISVTSPSLKVAKARKTCSIRVHTMVCRATNNAPSLRRCAACEDTGFLWRTS